MSPSQHWNPQAQVILAWHEAWNKDIDAFMALVADDAVLDRGPHGVITGKENIRATVLLEIKENLRAKVSKFEVEGDQVTYYYEVFIGGRRHARHVLAIALQRRRAECMRRRKEGRL